MPQPSRTPIPYSNRLKFLCKTELNSILRELNVKYKYQKIETNYEKLNVKLTPFNDELLIYRFNSNVLNHDKLFDLTFYLVNTRNNIILKNNIQFKNILETNINKHIYEKICDINLIETLENRYVNKYFNYNKKECNEIMRKACYLINEFIKNNPNINIYTIGKNINIKLLDRYIEIFSGIFSNEFKCFEGSSSGYNDGAIYFIRKNILKKD